MNIIFESVVKHVSSMANKNDGSSYELYDDNEISLAEHVENALASLKAEGEVIDYSVINDEAFDSPGCSCGVVSFSWIDNSYQLGHESFLWTIC